MQGEVHAGGGHEDDGHQLDEGGVELPYTRVVGREPTDGHGRERVGDRVEWTHPRRPIGEAAQHGEQQVEIPQRLGGLGDPRRELGVLHRPRRLGAVELHPADAEHRKDGDREHDDPHASEPLQQVAVEQYRLGEIVQPGDDCRTRGGQARDGLEHRVGERQVGGIAQQQRDAAGDAEREPEPDDDDESVSQPEVASRASYRKPERGPRPGDEQHRDDERRRRRLVVDPRDADGGQHGEAEHHEEQAENALNGAELHDYLSKPAYLTRSRLR